MPPRLVVFEPDVEGHPLEWLRHLVRYSAEDDRPYALHLVVAPELIGELADEVARTGARRAQLLPLTPFEQRICSHRSLTACALGRWWTMRRYLRGLDADAGHFLGLDLIALPLTLGFGFAGRTVSGILFRASTHRAELGDPSPPWRERLRDWRKAVLYRGLLRNPALDNVLALDPYFEGFAATQYPCGGKVHSICDPVNEQSPIAPGDGRLADKLSRERVNFLLFGFLAARKGVLVLVEALRGISPETAGRVGIVLAGAVDPRIRPELVAGLAKLRQEQPRLWVHLEDRRVTDGEIGALVARADCILAPYQRHVGSSGVLLWAARANKPVITQNVGLLGRLVRDFRLGLAVDTSRADCLARAIGQVAGGNPAQLIDARATGAFHAERTPREFAATIIDAALKSAENTATGRKRSRADSLNMITRPASDLRPE